MATSVLSDESDGAVSMRVVRAVGRAADTDPALLPSLYDSIDPDALDAVAESAGTCSITFAFAGHTVSIEPDGAVSVDSADE